jgi:hypothetical protein
VEFIRNILQVTFEPYFSEGYLFNFLLVLKHGRYRKSNDPVSNGVSNGQQTADLFMILMIRYTIGKL